MYAVTFDIDTNCLSEKNINNSLLIVFWLQLEHVIKSANTLFSVPSSFGSWDEKRIKV